MHTNAAKVPSELGWTRMPPRAGAFTLSGVEGSARSATVRSRRAVTMPSRSRRSFQNRMLMSEQETTRFSPGVLLVKLRSPARALARPPGAIARARIQGMALARMGYLRGRDAWRRLVERDSEPRRLALGRAPRPEGCDEAGRGSRRCRGVPSGRPASCSTTRGLTLGSPSPHTPRKGFPREYLVRRQLEHRVL